jgi:hypothetical protein
MPAHAGIQMGAADTICGAIPYCDCCMPAFEGMTSGAEAS